MPEAVDHVVLQIVGAAPRIAAGLAVILLAWLLALLARLAVRRVGARARRHRELWALAADVAWIAVLAFGVVSGLGTMGIDVAALVAGLGLIGFALGFALRDAVSNALSGVLILSYEPFRVGDLVSVAGTTGRVVRIDLRYTTIDTETDVTLMPNAKCFEGPVKVTKPPVPAEPKAD